MGQHTVEIGGSLIRDSSFHVVFAALLDCAAFVNERRLAAGEPAVLALAWQ